MSDINIEKVFRQRENVFGRLRNWPRPTVTHLPMLLPDIAKIVIEYCEPPSYIFDTTRDGKQKYISADDKKYFCTLPDPTTLHYVEFTPTKINGIKYNITLAYLVKRLDAVCLKYFIALQDEYTSYMIVYIHGKEVRRNISNGVVRMRYVNGVYIGTEPLFPDLV
jgi:hypothetical protein